MKDILNQNSKLIVDKLEEFSDDKAIDFLSALPQASSTADAVELLSNMSTQKREAITRRIIARQQAWLR